MYAFVCFFSPWLGVMQLEKWEGQVREKDKEEDRWNQVGKRGGQVESGRKRS